MAARSFQVSWSFPRGIISSRAESRPGTRIRRKPRRSVRTYLNWALGHASAVRLGGAGRRVRTRTGACAHRLARLERRARLSLSLRAHTHTRPSAFSTAGTLEASLRSGCSPSHSEPVAGSESVRAAGGYWSAAARARARAVRGTVIGRFPRAPIVRRGAERSSPRPPLSTPGAPARRDATRHGDHGRARRSRPARTANPSGAGAVWSREASAASGMRSGGGA